MNVARKGELNGQRVGWNVSSYCMFLGNLSANTLWSTLRHESARKLQSSRLARSLKDLQASTC